MVEGAQIALLATIVLLVVGNFVFAAVVVKRVFSAIPKVTRTDLYSQVVSGHLRQALATGDEGKVTDLVVDTDAKLTQAESPPPPPPNTAEMPEAADPALWAEAIEESEATGIPPLVCYQRALASEVSGGLEIKT